jgi:WhiB family transcriptional regulator, redox-sensing transcriptional regulator
MPAIKEGVALLYGTDLADRNTTWMDEALCSYYFDPEIWFPESQHGSNKRIKETAIAISICQECPVRAECYADALERGEHYGIWGGVDFYVPEDKHKLKEAS